MAKRLLFVCLGNICRSPAAEGIMNTFVQQAGQTGNIICDSAGTSSYHEGETADPRMIEIAKSRGHKLTSLSRPFRAPEDFENFDLILTMDESNFENIRRFDIQKKFVDKVIPMVRYCQIHEVKEVPDPYYQGEDGFHLVIDILEDACKNLLNELTRVER